VERHQSGYKERLQRAQKKVAVQPEEVRRRLEDLLTDLDWVKKQDRLGPIKRSAFQALVQLLERQESYAPALEWADRWVAFDQRDLNALLQQARLMYHAPGQPDQRLEAMAELYRRMPEVKRVALGYAELLHLSGEREQAASVFESFSRLPLNQRPSDSPVAQVFWDYGSGISAATRAQALPIGMEHGLQGLFFYAEAGVTRLRIDPFESLVRPRLFIWDADGSHMLELTAEQLKLNQMRRIGDHRLVVEGEDAYLVWDLPVDWTGRPLSMFLAATVDNRPLRMLDEDAVASDADAGAVPELAELKARVLARLETFPLELFWRTQTQPFSERRKQQLSPRLENVDGASMLEASFELAQPADEIRIDLAPLHFSYRTLELQLDLAGGPGSGEPQHVKPVSYHHLRQEDGWLRVAGGDPYIVFRPPTAGQDVTSGRFRSQVR
jgi:hypothetical protein